MKAKVKIELYSEFEIDLENYGYDKDTTFESLPEDEQYEISDLLRDEIVPEISIKTIE